MSKYLAVYDKVICTITKKLETTNGEYKLNNGLVLTGSNPNKAPDYDKFIATITSVGPEAIKYGFTEGSKAHVGHTSGQILEEVKTDTEVTRIMCYKPEEILALVKE